MGFSRALRNIGVYCAIGVGSYLSGTAGYEIFDRANYDVPRVEGVRSHSAGGYIDGIVDAIYYGVGNNLPVLGAIGGSGLAAYLISEHILRRRRDE